MSAKDLIARWEDALVQALTPDRDDKVSDQELVETAHPQLRINSGLHAGYTAATFQCGGACMF